MASSTDHAQPVIPIIFLLAVAAAAILYLNHVAKLIRFTRVRRSVAGNLWGSRPGFGIRFRHNRIQLFIALRGAQAATHRFIGQTLGYQRQGM